MLKPVGGQALTQEQKQRTQLLEMQARMGHAAVCATKQPTPGSTV